MLDEANREKLARLAQQLWRSRTIPSNLLSQPQTFLRENGIDISPGTEVQARAGKDWLSFELAQGDGPGEGCQTQLTPMPTTLPNRMLLRFEFKLVWD